MWKMLENTFKFKIMSEKVVNLEKIIQKNRLKLGNCGTRTKFEKISYQQCLNNKI